MSDPSASDGPPTAAFILSLIAGIWMLAMSGMMAGWAPSWGGAGHGMMGGGMGNPGVMGTGWPWLGLVTGIGVLVGAIGLYARPSVAPTWGIVIVLAAAINLFIGMGGFLASLLGLIGGGLALAGPTQQSS